jgi:hypothetical protein
MSVVVEPLYFPILRAKKGELEAIGRLSPLARVLTRPMLDFPRVEWTEAASISRLMHDKIVEIKRSWGTEREICLDFSRYHPDELAQGEFSLVEYTFHVAQRVRLRCVPVVAPLSLRGPGTAYFDAVSRVASRDRRGLAIRVPSGDFATRGALESVLAKTLQLVSVEPSDADVYLDAASLYGLSPESEDEFALVQAVCEAAITTHNLGFRRTIFAASSMPDSLVRQRKGRVTHIPRPEFRMWRQVIAGHKPLLAAFGDYAAIYPTQTEPDVPRAPPSRIRITTDDEHLLYKGVPEDMRILTKRAVEDGTLNTAADSWGEHAIRECAAGYGDPGNASTWVARDTNMHIENVVSAVVNEPAAGVSKQLVDQLAHGGTPWLQDALFRADGGTPHHVQ